MVQLLSNSIEDSIGIFSLMMNVFDIINFDCIIPPLTFFARRSMNSLFLSNNLYRLCCRQMDGKHPRSICKVPSFTSTSLNIKARSSFKASVEVNVRIHIKKCMLATNLFISIVHSFFTCSLIPL